MKKPGRDFKNSKNLEEFRKPGENFQKSFGHPVYTILGS